MQRNAPGPQFGGQQPGPSMSPHSCPTGPMHHNVGSYQLGPSYGPQSGQYGPSGNTHIPSSSACKHLNFFPLIVKYKYALKC